jgi:hypothetical protein
MIVCLLNFKCISGKKKIFLHALYGIRYVTVKYVVLALNLFLFIRGLPCPHSFQASLTQNFLKLILSGIPYNILPISCGDIGFLKRNLGQVLAGKSGLKVPLLPLGPSCPLQNYSA